jgi:hypothetical protein
MKMSYFPGGNPEPAVVFGASPCGGGGGGALIIAYTDSGGLVPAQQTIFMKKGFCEPNLVMYRISRYYGYRRYGRS